ncbi:MBL fold metallo-hydrolase [Desulfohalovibrio reitneri]|uniref:MBL fold metallo-hydrolase n=1 Tax=Desulfohalovibrio reitneri TaxID=1307759 RepID=UPI0004A6D694|nr:MBL fold metallo-hydrolase [Desulfohalovibrio reitneri]
MLIHSFVLGPLETNCYVLADRDTGRALVIDPGLEPGEVAAFLARFHYYAEAVLLTHLHADHVAGAAELARETGAEVLGPEADRFLLDRPEGGGGYEDIPPTEPFEMRGIGPGRLTLAGQPVLALPVPGHTPGSLCYFFPALESVFTGDCLFRGTVGHTRGPGGDAQGLLDAIRARLLTLPPETEVFPGHGPATTISRERAGNPFFADGRK